MKRISIPLAILAALAATVLVHAEDEPSAASAARILGEIPDGSPPVSRSPKVHHLIITC